MGRVQSGTSKRTILNLEKLTDEYGQRTKWQWESGHEFSQQVTTTREDITDQMRRLKSIRQRLTLFDSEVEEFKKTGSSTLSPQSTRVFVVHGHDGRVKLEVAEFLEKIIGERPVILHEQADSGRTIIEKFEQHASEAGFAVVLLTADDVGRAKETTGLRTPDMTAR